ncbi:acyl carrier protein [Cuneatibacter sp. NSJ-177]|uniref:acyl carrier protein n=1 Tax=Cuneatibacter sp. NSJ-177 TaxID=2931401 RepID=UPI001FD317C1|nr:acyl carrier protein [Cuneatibacter sp. NSJ-177]MCJ7834240.1 acyl carrier protein [Cuneatibacter sp. NSJ-177]
MEFEKIQEIIASVLKIEPELITLEKSFEDDLGADSLDRVEIIMQLEDELGVEIPDEVAENIKTVGDALEEIRKVNG